MPIFRVKSVKIYTGQKKFTRTPSVASVTNMRYELNLALRDEILMMLEHFRTLRTSPCLQTVAKLPTTAVQRFKRWTSPRLPLSTPPILVHRKLVQQLGMVGSVGTQGTLARIVPSKNAPQSTINKRKTPFLSAGAVQNTSTFLRMGATGESDVTVSVIGFENSKWSLMWTDLAVKQCLDDGNWFSVVEGNPFLEWTDYRLILS